MALLIIVATALPACSAYKKCGLNGCSGDAELTAAVQTEFAQRSELGPPNTIRIQTLDHVVYLRGLVDTEFERRIAESVAQEVPGVTRVVNAITVLTDVH